MLLIKKEIYDFCQSLLATPETRRSYKTLGVLCFYEFDLAKIATNYDLIVSLFQNIIDNANDYASCNLRYLGVDKDDSWWLVDYDSSVAETLDILVALGDASGILSNDLIVQVNNIARLGNQLVPYINRDNYDFTTKAEEDRWLDIYNSVLLDELYYDINMEKIRPIKPKQVFTIFDIINIFKYWISVHNPDIVTNKYYPVLCKSLNQHIDNLYNAIGYALTQDIPLLSPQDLKDESSLSTLSKRFSHLLIQAKIMQVKDTHYNQEVAKTLRRTYEEMQHFLGN